MINEGEKLYYWWIRIFDYAFERDGHEKGTMLDEFYIKEADNDREKAKDAVREKYTSSISQQIKFAKPKKKDGIYAVILDSSKFYYDRFYAQVDSLCFWCYKPVKGKASEFPREYIGEGDRWNDINYDEFGDLSKTAYYCTPSCKKHYVQSQRSVDHEGEFQEKEKGRQGSVFGYVYLIYNRSEDIYYIGQTRFMPFFRWQEHVKDGSKGDICDLTFSVLTEVNRSHNEEHDQQYLNSIEAWWINKYEYEGLKVFNISRPKITIRDLKEKFNQMVLKQEQLELT